MGKKYSVVFSVVENYFLQCLLHPLVLVLVLGVGVILAADFVYNFSNDLKYTSILICWGILGMLFKHINPFHFVSTNFETSDDTEIIIRFRGRKLSGVLKSVKKQNDLLEFKIQTKKTSESLCIPVTILNEIVCDALIELLRDVKGMNFQEIERKLMSAGLSSHISLDNEKYRTYSLGSKPYFIIFKFWALILAFALCYVLVFHTFV